MARRSKNSKLKLPEFSNAAERRHPLNLTPAEALDYFSALVSYHRTHYDDPAARFAAKNPKPFKLE